MDERAELIAKLIAKLNDYLKGWEQVCIHKDYTLASPEVQNIPMYGLEFRCREIRLIRDVLTTYHNQRNEK